MKSLAAKLVKILASVESVGKSGWNDFHKYHYATEEDVLQAVKKALIDNNVFVTQSSKITDVRSVTAKDRKGEDKTSFVTSVETSHTFIDADSGEQFTVTSAGQGHDSLDKGVFKAVTGANKYFLMKNFMISTGDDPEATTASKAPKSAASGDDFETPVAAPKAVQSAPPPVAVSSAPAFLTANKAAAPAALSKEIPKGIAAQGKVVNMSNPEPEF